MTGPTPIAIFKKFQLFSEFPEESLQEFAKAAQLHTWPAHKMLLKQGQVNDQLYFLLSGQVGVYVDGGLVSTLKTAGDLLGEMSVINQQPCAATIVTDIATEVVSVDVARLDQSTLLYRLYARVLSQKLHQTNQKAKLFEELSLQLKATQAELEELQKQKDQEDSTNHSRILKRVNDVYSREILPRKALLQENPMWAGTIDILSSIANLYSSSTAIHRKRVLVADASKKQQLIAKLALGGTGVELEIVSSLEEGREKLDGVPFDLVFVDSSLTELANLVREKSATTGLVMMTSDQIPNYLGNLKKLSRIPHIVSRNEGDRTFSIKNISTTVTKLLNRDLFGLEKYLSWGADVQSIKIERSSQRPELLSSVDTYLEKLGVRRTQRERIHSVLEELLMNAIYDAPTDSNGKHIYNHLPRTAEVLLTPAQQGLLRFACDGMCVAVSVQDPFGALNGETLLRYLENCYSDQAGGLNAGEGKGGAGRGLHLIVQNSDLVVFNLAPGQRTEVIALFNLELKETAHLNPSFHLFIQS